jgi:TPR repeat protein
MAIPNKKVVDKTEALIVCGFCSGSDVPDGGFKACSRCKLVHYCSKECQVAHWKREVGGHKQFCIAPADRKPTGTQIETEEISMSPYEKVVEEAAAPLMCSFCSTENPPKGGFKICSRCKSARYCSTECQTSHWKKGHNQVCVAPAAAAEEQEALSKIVVQECAICLEKISSSNKYSLPCEHVFHIECIANLRLASTVQSCPLCRGDLPPGPMQSFLRGCEVRNLVESAFRKSKGKLSWEKKLPRELQELSDEMVKMWTYAASEGDMQAQYNLGIVYSQGQGVKKDMKKAMDFYMKAADGGSVHAMVNAGHHYENTNQPAKGVALYKKAANLGYAMAQYNLGNNYLYGQGVKQSYADAAHWFEKAALQGYREAQANYANILNNGYGAVEVNVLEAEKWYLCAANQGDAMAMCSLGKMYMRGRVIPVNMAKAKYWFKKSAAGGEKEAVFIVQQMFGGL